MEKSIGKQLADEIRSEKDPERDLYLGLIIKYKEELLDNLTIIMSEYGSGYADRLINIAEDMIDDGVLQMDITGLLGTDIEPTIVFPLKSLDREELTPDEEEYLNKIGILTFLKGAYASLLDLLVDTADLDSSERVVGMAPLDAINLALELVENNDNLYKTRINLPFSKIPFNPSGRVSLTNLYVIEEDLDIRMIKEDDSTYIVVD